ncbi:diguanylate cyclase [Aquabacterium commune]|uniref:diguanylate cyclase n=1 Tax=Aquabacterium commune TaxID=70586 RepID=A0A4R6RCG7_9BURK|nr:diguanylate cyclase [Aquabacterium commune]TDP83812.1 diguanylate cyclase [Aquabacterium commune]
MSTPPTTPPAAPAQLAKAALRRLAEQRLEPTPDNFRKAYEAESGITSEADSAPPAAAALSQAVNQAEEGERWSKLIGRILRGAERGGRQWTAARKKDSLQRVLEGSKNSGQRLHQRLSQLVQSWDSDTLDNTLMDDVANSPASPESPEPPALPSTEALPEPAHASAEWPANAAHAAEQLSDTVHAALPPATGAEAGEALRNALAATREAAPVPEALDAARQELAQACEQARRVIEHRHSLIDQLTGLCQSLTDSLVDLSEDDSWAQGQAQAMRHQLETGLNHRGVRHVQQLLSDARERQKQLKVERAAARDALKHLIHQMLQEIGELGSTTDRFQSNLGRYADTIGQADSLESLTGVVREMVEESRAVQSVVAQTQVRLHDEHAKANALTERVRTLEDEIRKLSDEVSTDPLTQIANRRGMMRAFEAEQARVDRHGASLAIGLLDVDNFKKLNDQMGHQTGDEALKFLARRVGECLRPVDVVARYGGEEFVVLLPDTPAEEGQQVLTRLQRTLSAEFFTHEDKKVFITFSAGVTSYRLGEAIEAALERADVGLYEAKRTGKNRTCIN